MVNIVYNSFVALLLLVLLPWFGIAVQAQQEIPAYCTEGPRTPGELRTALLKDYDPLTRPGVAALAINNNNNTAAAAVVAQQAKPDVARIQLHVLSLNSVDNKRNEFELSVWFRRSWYDVRLQYKSSSQGGCFPDDGRVGFSSAQQIWAPDLYIENQAKTSDTISDAVWIYPSGRVVHVSQLELTLACQMQFEDFPRDTQQCGFRVGTWLEDANDVILDFYQDLDPVTLAQDTTDPNALPRGGTTEWTIVAARGVNISSVAGATQAESAVEIQLDLRRNVQYYKDWVIVPTMMFVIVGWFSFFIHRSAAPARVTMAMIGFLANANFLSNQLGQLPRLGDDVWLLAFLSRSAWFTFYAVFEYVVCNWLRRIEDRIDGARKRVQQDMDIRSTRPHHGKKSKKKKRYDEEMATAEQAPPIVITKDHIMASGFNFKVDALLMKQDTRMYFKDEHVDVFSRYAYPIAYLIMSTVMWFNQ